MFEQIGEFKPDSLIAGNEFPIMKEGIGLKAGYGVLKRGSLIMKGTDNAGYVAGTVVEVKKGEGESATTSKSPFIPGRYCFRYGRKSRKLRGRYEMRGNLSSQRPEL